MELIKILPTKKRNGYNVSYAIFLCPYCLQEVEKEMSSGKRQKSCGCTKNELISESNKGKKRTEEQRQNISEAKKGKKYTKERRQKISESTIGKNNPMYGKKHTDETRQKQREAKLGRKREKESINKQIKSLTGKKRKPFTKEHRDNMSESQKGKHCGKMSNFYGVHLKGENSPNWNGGTSFLPYPPEFNKELKAFILERDNYTCQCLDCTTLKETDLHIHHIDYDKQNNNPENLITLCNSCHSKTNAKKKRKYYTKYYQIRMMGKLMGCLL